MKIREEGQLPPSHFAAGGLCFVYGCASIELDAKRYLKALVILGDEWKTLSLEDYSSASPTHKRKARLNSTKRRLPYFQKDFKDWESAKKRLLGRKTGYLASR